MTNGRTRGCTDKLLVGLHTLFKQALAASTQRRPRLVAQVLEHPTFVATLRSATVKATWQQLQHSSLFEDVEHDVGIRIQEHLRAGRIKYVDRGPEQFGAWLFTVLENSARKALNCLTVQSRREVSLEEAKPLLDPRDHFASVDNEDFRTEAVKELERTTTPRQRKAFLDFLAGKSPSDIAASLGVARGTVSKWITAARERMRRRFEADE